MQTKKLVALIRVNETISLTHYTGSFPVPGHHEKILKNGVRLERAVLTAGGVSIHCPDLHPADCGEFIDNGGLFPIHNLVNEAEGPLSPAPHPALRKVHQELGSPISVFYPYYFDIFEGFTQEEIARTFGVPIDRVMHPQHVLWPTVHIETGNVVIAPKRHFDPLWLMDGISDQTAFGKLEVHFPGDDHIFLVTGVTACLGVLATVVGLRHKFPKSRILLVWDAISPLAQTPADLDELNAVKIVIKHWAEISHTDYVLDKILK